MKKHPIWEYLKQNNMTDLNESDFIMAYSDPEKAKQVWGYIKDNGMTDLDERSFYNSYFSSDTEYYQGLKKKEPSSQDLSQRQERSGASSQPVSQPVANDPYSLTEASKLRIELKRQFEEFYENSKGSVRGFDSGIQNESFQKATANKDAIINLSNQLEALNPDQYREMAKGFRESAANIYAEANNSKGSTFTTEDAFERSVKNNVTWFDNNSEWLNNFINQNSGKNLSTDVKLNLTSKGEKRTDNKAQQYLQEEAEANARFKEEMRQKPDAILISGGPIANFQEAEAQTNAAIAAGEDIRPRRNQYDTNDTYSKKVAEYEKRAKDRQSVYFKDWDVYEKEEKSLQEQQNMDDNYKYLNDNLIKTGFASPKTFVDDNGNTIVDDIEIDWNKLPNDERFQQMFPDIPLEDKRMYENKAMNPQMYAQRGNNKYVEFENRVKNALKGTIQDYYTQNTLSNKDSDVVIQKVIDQNFNEDSYRPYLKKQDGTGTIILDIDKINESIDKIADHYNLPLDGTVRRNMYHKAEAKMRSLMLKDDADAFLEANNPELMKRVREQQERNPEAFQTTEEYLALISNFKSNTLAMSNMYGTLAKDEMDKLSSDFKARMDNVNNKYNPQLSQIQTTLQELESARAANRISELEYGSQRIQLEKAYTDLYNQYTAEFPTQEEFLRAQNTALNAFTVKSQKEYDMMLDGLNQQLDELFKKYSTLDPALKAELEAAMNKAYSDAADLSGNEMERRFNANESTNMAHSQLFTYLKGSFGNYLKSMGQYYNLDGAVRYGQLISEEATRPDVKIGEFSDLLDLDNFVALLGEAGGTTLPSMATAAAITIGSEGIGTPAALTFLATTLSGTAMGIAQAAGSAQYDMYEKTGDVSKALNAANEATKAEMELWWLHMGDALPFMKGFGGLVKTPRAVNLILKPAIELASETTEETLQSNYELNISEGRNRWDNRVVWEAEPGQEGNVVSIKENLIFSAPLSLIGGVRDAFSKGDLTKEEEDRIKYVSDQTKKIVGNVVDDQQRQYFQGMIDKGQFSQAQQALAGMYMTGQIDIEEFSKAESYIAQSQKIKETADEAKLKGVDRDVYSFFTARADESRRMAEKNANDPVMSKVFEMQSKDYTQAAADFLTTRTVPTMYTVEHIDGTRTMMTDSDFRNAMNDDSFMTMVAADKIAVTAYGDGSKQSMDMFKEKGKVYEQKVGEIREIPVLEDKRAQYVSSRAAKMAVSQGITRDEAVKIATDEWLQTEDGIRYTNLNSKYDTENKQGISSEEQQGKEPVQAEPIQGAGTTKVTPGGVVQGTQEEVTAEDLAQQQKEAEEASKLNDDEVYTFTYESEDEVPSVLKPLMRIGEDRTATVRKGLFGKKQQVNIKSKPVVIATGKDIKDAYNAAQTSPEVVSQTEGEVVTEATPKSIQESVKNESIGGFTIQATTNGLKTFSGDPNLVEDPRSTKNTMSSDFYGRVVESEKDGKKVFTYIGDEVDSDSFGRLGFISVSLQYPADTKLTADDVKPILQAKAAEAAGKIKSSPSATRVDGSSFPALETSPKVSAQAEPKAEGKKEVATSTEPVFNDEIKTPFKSNENMLFNQGGVDNLQTQIGVSPDLKSKYSASKKSPLSDAIRKIGRVYEGDKVDLRGMNEQQIIDFANGLDEMQAKNDKYQGKRAVITKSSNFGRDVEQFDGRVIGYGGFGVRIVTDDGRIVEGKKYSEYKGTETKTEVTPEVKAAPTQEVAPEVAKGTPTEVTPQAEPKSGKREKRRAELSGLFEEAEKNAEKIRQGLSDAGISVNVVSKEEMEDISKKKGQYKEVADGIFFGDDGQIYLREDRASDPLFGKGLAFHEGIHPIINIIRNTNPKLYKAIVDGLNKLAQTNPGIAGAKKWADQNEDPQTKEDEFVVESLARLSSGEIDPLSIPKNLLDKIIDFLNKISKALFGKSPLTYRSSPKDVQKLAEQVTDLFDRYGRLADVVGKENVSKYKLEDPTKVLSSDTSSPSPLSQRAVDRAVFGDKIIYKEGGYNLSFVKKEDIIDIEALVKKIAQEGGNVWFWTADQLGRGMYSDETFEGEHYLDAGPSFALDEENRTKNIIWASGADAKTLINRINNSDYIFIVSGSPQQSKLFNKQVLKLLGKRIDAAAGGWSNFRKNVIEKTTKIVKSKDKKDVVKTTQITELIKKYESFEGLINSKGNDKKKLFVELENQKYKANTPLKKYLDSIGLSFDVDSLRDGFYRENNFDINDVLLVLKPTALGGKSSHSTYENDILGEVVGVPDRKVNGIDLLPEERRKKYSEAQRKAPMTGAAGSLTSKVAQAAIGRRMAPSAKAKTSLTDFSNNVGETIDRIKSATSEDGATLNLDGTTYEDGGLVVPAGSLNVAQDEVSEKGLFDFLKDNEENISSDIFKIGLYKFEDRPEVSYDLNIVIPREYRDIALQFGKLAGQESLFDLDTFENIKTGSDGKNPRTFTAQELAEIAKDLSEGRVPSIVQPSAKVDRSLPEPTPERITKASENLENKFRRDGIPLSKSEAEDIVMELVSWKDWYDGITKMVQDNFGEYSADYMMFMFGSAVAADSAGTIGTALNNLERLYGQEEIKGLPIMKRNIYEILSGLPVSSDKISNFIAAGLGDKTAIPVDMHVWSFINSLPTTKGPSSKRDFERAKEFIRAVADGLGWDPREVQAAMWAANMLRLGQKPDTYEQYIQKKIDSGLQEQIQGWRDKGYQPIFAVRQAGEKIETIFLQEEKKAEFIPKLEEVNQKISGKKEAPLQPSAKIDRKVEETAKALEAVMSLKNEKQEPFQKNEGANLIRAEFGRNGEVSYEVDSDGNAEVLSIERNKGEREASKIGAIGEGSMAIASIFNKHKNIDTLYYDDDSEGFWDAIGGKGDSLTREDFFKYYNKKSKQISEAYHKAKADGSNPELVKAVEDLIGKPQFAAGRAGGVSQDTILDAMDEVDNAIESGLSAEQAIQENILSQPWYGQLSDDQKAKVDSVINTEYGVNPSEIVTASESAQKLEDLYNSQEKGYKNKIQDLLADDPELKYIYNNIPKILNALEQEGIIKKNKNCP